VLDAMLAGPRGKSGFLSRERPVAGPFAPWLLSPGFAHRAQELGAYVRYGTLLDARLKELAIIVVGAAWKAGYEFAAHGPMAIRAGVSGEVVAALARAETPSFDRDDERIVYEFARDLVENRRVADERYAAAVELLGEAGTVELVGTLGYYTLVCMTLNAFEVPLGEGMEPPFAAP
jgi:4-carboxymuconolactone decarboxylase